MDSFTLFAAADCGIAENPLWNEDEQALYWKGSGGRIFRQASDATPTGFACFRLPIGQIGGFVFSGDAFLVFAQRGRVWRWRPGEGPVLVAELPDADEKTYFNDVIADPEGRVYCGVLAHDFHNPATRGKHGSLWRLDADCSLHCLDATTGACPNGMGFSPGLRQFYFVVSDERTVYRYDYDRASGAIADRAVLIECPGADGMTVDAEGCLWIACWRGPTANCLRRYSPAGSLLLEYGFPADVRAVSSVTLGGHDLRTLFVTTANYPDDGKTPAFLPGGVFHLRQGIAGRPEFRIR
jgi:D-xylonolactonase